jgi:hypothetical protein
MTRWLPTFLLLIATFADRDKAVPADFDIPVHVVSCRLINQCGSVSQGSGSCGYAQHLAATIAGKKVELERLVDTNMLRAGDYKARLLVDKHPRPEEYTQVYQFLFSDGKTGDFIVVGEAE